MRDVDCFSLVFNDELIWGDTATRIILERKPCGSERPPQNRHRVPFSSASSLQHCLTRRSTMYEETWYTYVSDSHKRDDASSQDTKHQRRESLLKQTNVSPPLARSRNCTNGRSREQAKYLTLRVQSWNYLREVPD